MDSLILVSEPKAAKKLKGMDLRSSVVVSLNESSSGSLKNAGIIFSTINDFLQQKESKDLTQKSIRWLREWANKSRIKEITYRNISVWWFFDFWLYQSFFRWDMVKTICWYTDTIKIILRKTKPKRVTAFCNPTVAEIVSQLHPGAEIRKSRNFQHMHPYLIDYGLRAKHCLRKWMSRVLNRKHSAENRDIMFTTYTSWFRQCVREDGSEGKEDAILGYVVRRAMKDHKILVTDIDFIKSIGFSKMKEMKKKENIPFEHYLSWRTDRYSKKKAEEVRKQWESADKKKIEKASVYEGVNIYGLLRPWLEFVFRNRIYMAIRYIETALEMMDKENPRLIVAVDETAIFGRSIIAAARIKGIPIMAVQHGYITPEAFEYSHIKGDISGELSQEKPYCPIADKTFVYGPYTKEILTVPGNYPEKSIEMTGQPRYDCLARGKAFDKKKVFSQYGLDRKKKLVLWTTQMIAGQEDMIFSAMKSIKDAQLMVKLHPREIEGVKPYYEKAKKMGLRIKAVQQANTFELINACDVMITMFSTTGLEALMMGKPLIVLNVSGRPDHVPFVQEGAALGVYSPDKLKDAIKKLLSDKRFVQELLKKGRDYSYKHAYKMDGKATDRVLDSIKEVLSH
ncbi:MAG: CDP-glycerol glycerophosphotransferase family protein [Nanoarchaeota archaeon]|nr:CDP-glycerol glycerophosphotransferase family protein [Nanoarchaeota archaeon]